MALLHVNFYSRTLERETQMDVILPEAAKKLIGMEGVATRQCKTLYLLHGMSDDQTVWQRRTSIERYAAAYGLAVVMPTTDLGWYTDMYRGDKYFAFITRELPAVCRDLFPMMSPRREDTYVAGLSMGGYGALKCALKRPESYAACAAFSSVTDYPGRAARADERERREIRAIVGPDGIVPEDEDLFALLKKADASALPEFYMTCGEQDALYGENVRFARALEEKGARLRFDHWEGTHSWELWDRSIKQTMELFFGNRR